jgi:hypothetical protein
MALSRSPAILKSMISGIPIFEPDEMALTPTRNNLTAVVLTLEFHRNQLERLITCRVSENLFGLEHWHTRNAISKLQGEIDWIA